MNDTNKPDFYESLRYAVETVGNVAREEAHPRIRMGLFRQRDAVLAALRTAERQRDRKADAEEARGVEELERRCRQYEQDLSAMGKDLMTEKETLREERMRAEEIERQLMDTTRQFAETERKLLTAERKLEEEDKRKHRYSLVCHELHHAIMRLGGTDEDINHAWRIANEFLDDPDHPSHHIVAEGNKPKDNPTDLSQPDPDQHVLNELAFGASDDHLCRALIGVAEGEPVTHMKSALLAAAADRLGVDVFPGEDTLKRRRITKGELAEALYPEHKGYRVDCALPQAWVNSIDGMLTEENRTRINASGGVAWNFVTVYHDECPGGVIMPTTRMGVFIMAAIASHL